jgi:long-subunit acyl-CoA synthetase (AMP-forming)
LNLRVLCLADIMNASSPIPDRMVRWNCNPTAAGTDLITTSNSYYIRIAHFQLSLQLPHLTKDDLATIVYTSGTTGR